MKKAPTLSCGAFDVTDLPALTWRQQVPPEAPIVHRLDMRSPPISQGTRRTRWQHPWKHYLRDAYNSKLSQLLMR
ncbi:MAG: hypothetical protein P8Y28_09650 [Gammaproteobacteria bacterium]